MHRTYGVLTCAALVLACACGGRQIDHAADAGKHRSSGGVTSDGGARSVASLPMNRESCLMNDLTIAYAPDIYSAYIEGGTHLFRVMEEAQGVNEYAVNWTASDPSMVQIEPNYQGGVTLTMKKAGDVVITANASGRCGSVTLHIDAATEEEWQLGNARFNAPYPLPAIDTKDGIPVSTSMGVLDPPGMPPGCTNCHSDQPTRSLFETIKPNPAQAEGDSDQQLIDIITKGADPMDGYFEVNSLPWSVWTLFHKWSDVEGAEAVGMVVYLRSLWAVEATQTDTITPLKPARDRDGGKMIPDAGVPDAGVRDAATIPGIDGAAGR